MKAREFRDFVASRVPDVPTFYSQFPPDPSRSLAVFRYGGASDSHLIGYDEFAFQVAARGESYDDAETLADAVYTALHGMTHVDVGEWRAKAVLANSPPLIGWKDENERWVVTVNFRVRAFKT